MSIQVTNIDAVTREISRIFKMVEHPDLTYRVAKKGSPYVMQVYKSLTYPNRERRAVHYFYGYPVARGNWQKSIEELDERRKRIRVKGIAIVGPRYNTRSRSKRTVGLTEKSAWANYAHMIYGSARAYYRQITEKALNQSAPMALPAMLQEAKLILEIAAGRVNATGGQP